MAEYTGPTETPELRHLALMLRERLGDARPVVIAFSESRQLSGAVEYTLQPSPSLSSRMAQHGISMKSINET